MSFKSFLQDKLGSHNPDEVEILNLDSLLSNQRYISEEIKETLEEYFDLKHLNLNHIGLACLKNLPFLPSLKSFEVRENLLCGDDLQLILTAFPSIRKLKIGQNHIKKLDFFDCFAKSNLTILEVYDNPLTDDIKYKEILFYKIKSLEIIDTIDRDGYNVDTYISDYDDEDDEVDEDVEDEEEGKKSNSNSNSNSNSISNNKNDLNNSLLLNNKNNFNKKESNSSLDCNDDDDDNYRSKDNNSVCEKEKRSNN